jgi:hypothetical protein
VCPPPKAKRKPRPAPPIEAPQIDLGQSDEGADLRSVQRRGRNQLRTNTTAGSIGSGLAIPTPGA